MVKPTRTFATQHAQGRAAEEALDGWLRQRFGAEPLPVGRDLQQAGIDRQVGPVTVEVKADSQGHRTGNAFVETISVDRAGRPGWVFTCQADWLVYWLTGSGDGWLLSPAVLRAEVWDWVRRFTLKVASNPDYHSYGVLVPHAELSRVATETFNWKGTA